MNTEAIRIGALGAGGFGLYALQQFTQIPGVELVGMAATHREAAFAMAQRFGVPDIQDPDKLLARDDINLIYIATPPFLHHPQAIKALKAGKHVICEKPFALDLRQADEMIAVAQKKHLLVIANLMQRYNPLFDIVRRIAGPRRGRRRPTISAPRQPHRRAGELHRSISRWHAGEFLSRVHPAEPDGSARVPSAFRARRCYDGGMGPGPRARPSGSG